MFEFSKKNQISSFYFINFVNQTPYYNSINIPPLHNISTQKIKLSSNFVSKLSQNFYFVRMDACNPILPPSPNIIDRENYYIYHDIDDEYTPRSPPEVIQAPSPEPKAIHEDEGKGEREDDDEDEGEGEGQGEGEGERESEDEDADEDEVWVFFFEKYSF